jgi:hypothetical protein
MMPTASVEYDVQEFVIFQNSGRMGYALATPKEPPPACALLTVKEKADGEFTVRAAAPFSSKRSAIETFDRKILTHLQKAARDIEKEYRYGVSAFRRSLKKSERAREQEQEHER